MLGEVDSCLERWIHAWRGGFMLGEVDSCLERWIHAWRGGFMLGEDLCLKRWIHAWTGGFMLGEVDACLESKRWKLNMTMAAMSVLLRPADHSGNIQETFREHSGSIQGTFREHSVRVERTPVSLHPNCKVIRRIQLANMST
jgi:hypothetical protein